MTVAVRPVFFLTDFGPGSHYAGVLHGVVAARAAGVPTRDLCHSVTPGRVREAGYLLEASLPYLPPDAVLAAVVDPGVGSGRGILAAARGDALLLAPDNGLLTGLLLDGRLSRVRLVDPRRLGIEPASRTFHGRDIFAPAAAMLAAGLPLDSVGPPAPAPLRLDGWLPRCGDREIAGEVVHVDAFGNLISNIGESLLKGRGDISVRVGAAGLSGLRGFYGEAESGEALLYIGSSGHLEAGVRDGSASRTLSVRVGDPFVVLWR